MKSQDIRRNWIDFFSSKKGHKHLLSASLVPNNPTLLLTNAGMVPFVPYFLGQEKPPSSRVVSVQKCVRVGGKDSDLENIGKTSRHLTFFEMLGNFSFGDYFKEEVIPWSWELLTQVYGFKPESLIVSVFEGDDKVKFDQEAYDIWHKKVGVPENRIVKYGRADNFWGPPGGISGPCGPCSEIYYDPGNGKEPIEIWNLVFMQYEQFPDGSLKALPKPNVDTGAGLERMATILQNKESVFETDLMEPIVSKIKKIRRLKYSLDYYENSPREQHEKFAIEENYIERVIADHVRCSCMLLADGVKPSNTGRGYVLRMLIRRAARFGRSYHLKSPFLALLVPSVQAVFAGAYPELDKNIAEIKMQLIAEEEAFNRTIERGLKKFNEIVDKNVKVINGEEVFDLYATYGFPVELTVDLAEEKGITVDLEAYEKAREAHSEVSNQGKFSVGFKSEQNAELQNLPATKFIYKHSSEHFDSYRSNTDDEAKVLKIIKGENEDIVILDRTILYPEGGGQLSDRGIFEATNHPRPNIDLFEVYDVQKINDVVLHKGKLLVNYLKEGDTIALNFNVNRRKALEAHHTATHLLHAALRKVTNNEAEQRGSLVAPDRLRFDFACSKKLTENDLENIENQINEVIKAGIDVNHEEMSMKEAIEKGALAFFGDKYGDKVKVLSIVEEGEITSIELCGGTHVKNTSEIQGFKIISESAISSGVRRIEAVAGQAYIDYLRESDKQLEEMKTLLKTPREKVSERVEEIQNELKNSQKQLSELQKKLVKYQAEELLSKVISKDNISYLVSETEITDLKGALDFLSSKLQDSYVLFLVSNAGPKPSYAAKVKATNFKAKELVAKFASLVGGTGGGRDDFAQGGGGDSTKVSSALNSLLS